MPAASSLSVTGRVGMGEGRVRARPLGVSTSVVAAPAVIGFASTGAGPMTRTASTIACRMAGSPLCQSWDVASVMWVRYSSPSRLMTLIPDDPDDDPVVDLGTTALRSHAMLPGQVMNDGLGKLVRHARTEHGGKSLLAEA